MLRKNHSVSINSEYTGQNDFSLALSFAAGFGHNPIADQWRSYAGSIARQGAVSAKVYLDKNNNGQFDSGEESISNAGLTINNSRPNYRTDSNGVIYLGEIPPYKSTNINLSADTLEDPTWLANFDGIQFSPRPGKNLILNIPVVESGEIDGTTYLKINGKRLIAADVTIELVNRQGQIIRETKSAYDGFYILGNIPPGKYYLRINPEQFEKLSLTSPEIQAITINSDSQYVYGYDLILMQ